MGAPAYSSRATGRAATLLCIPAVAAFALVVGYSLHLAAECDGDKAAIKRRLESEGRVHWETEGDERIEYGHFNGRAEEDEWDSAEARSERCRGRPSAVLLYAGSRQQALTAAIVLFIACFVALLAALLLWRSAKRREAKAAAMGAVLAAINGTIVDMRATTREAQPDTWSARGNGAAPQQL